MTPSNPLTQNHDRHPWFVRLAALVLVVAVLKIGQDVLMPIAFAVLVVFMLTPSVMCLTRWGLPRAIAIIAAVGFAFVLTGAVAWLVTNQAMRLGQELPAYEQNLHRKIALLKQPKTPATFGHFTAMLEKARKEIVATTPSPTAPGTAGSTPDAKPVPVEVRNDNESTATIFRDFLIPVVHPLATAGIVIVFVVAMLFQREDLRDRFMRVAASGHLNIATQAVDDASRRISRYLWMQLVVNSAYGLPIGLGLYLIGVPNALLWGLMATILRFVPYVGSWIAAAFPVVLAVMIDPGWMKLIYTVGLFLAVELISSNLVEVVLYSGTTGISNLALIMAAVFWTWLWGVGGLILSTPLTVCLLVVGKYVSGLRGLSMLLGNEPALEPAERFYQAMLSMESEYMVDLATKHVAEHSLEEFYEDVFIPALILSEEDRHRGTLADRRQVFILQASRDLIEEFERRDDERGSAEQATDAAEAAPTLPSVLGLVVVIPARDTADALASLMAAHLLRRAGAGVEVVADGESIDQVMAHLAGHPDAIAFISALPPSALGSARSMCRRLRRAYPDLRIVVGVWSPQAELPEMQERLAPAAPTAVVTSLRDALAVIRVLREAEVRLKKP